MENGRLTIQLHVEGSWQDVATVALRDPGAGHRGVSLLSYEIGYVAAADPGLAGDVRDARAIGVQHPVGTRAWRLNAWPSPLLDLLPQGHGRATIRSALDISERDGDADDFGILLRAAGSPVGNMRIKEVADSEATRIAGVAPRGFSLDGIAARPDEFREAVHGFGVTLPGAFGIQGAWPKILMTQARDGLWYPDPVVPDGEALRHAIFKWAPADKDETKLILNAEAPYLELARHFGLHCAALIERCGDILVVPRFDRSIVGGRVLRFGQESIVSASGISAFGHEGSHEAYLETIKAVSADPAADVVEYVLRDVLNLALGNSDNHGRNTALRKDTQGGIGLSPLFDFTPMRMAAEGIRRSTKWACMQRAGGGSGDLSPDWSLICEVAAEGVMDPAELKSILAQKADLLHETPTLARRLGVPEPVIERAMAWHEEVAAGLQALKTKPRRRPRPRN